MGLITIATNIKTDTDNILVDLQGINVVLIGAKGAYGSAFIDTWISFDKNPTDRDWISFRTLLTQDSPLYPFQIEGIQVTPRWLKLAVRGVNQYTDLDLFYVS
jgi:hypothetical protein